MRLSVLLILLFFAASVNYSQDNASAERSESTKIIETENAVKNTELYFNISNERILTTSVIFIEILILFAVLFYWKRTRIDVKESSNSIFKKNIKAMREEKIKPFVDPVTSEKRKMIIRSIRIRDLNSSNITNKAKKLSIGKGELLLAARINQIRSQNR